MYLLNSYFRSLWRQGLAGLGRKESWVFREWDHTHTHSHIRPDPPEITLTHLFFPLSGDPHLFVRLFALNISPADDYFMDVSIPACLRGCQRKTAQQRSRNLTALLFRLVSLSLSLSLLLQPDLSHCVQNSNSSSDIWDDQSGRFGEISFPTIVMGSARPSLRR